MDINVTQVLVSAVGSLLVSAAGAWIAGWLGVRRGLNQAIRQRAFDRRLDWYEQTFRLFNEFLVNLRNFAATYAPVESFNSEMVKKAVGDFLTSAEKVGTRINEGTVYAEKKTLRTMRKLLGQLQEVRRLPEGPKIETVDLQRKIGAIDNITIQITYELTTSIRKQLGLDKITEEEFRWKEPS